MTTRGLHPTPTIESYKDLRDRLEEAIAKSRLDLLQTKIRGASLAAAGEPLERCAGKVDEHYKRLQHLKALATGVDIRIAGLEWRAASDAFERNSEELADLRSRLPELKAELEAANERRHLENIRVDPREISAEKKARDAQAATSFERYAEANNRANELVAERGELAKRQSDAAEKFSELSGDQIDVRDNWDASAGS